MLSDPTILASVGPLVADSGEALITWTPRTFYLAAALAHTVLIWLGFRLLGADPEYNTFPAAIAAAVIGNLAAFASKEYAVAGFCVTLLAYYVALLATSGFDLFRSLLVLVLALGSYGALGSFITQRTPLDAYDISGVPKIIMTGGFQPQQLDDRDGDAVPDPHDVQN